jgi:hypothetical protein
MDITRAETRPLYGLASRPPDGTICCSVVFQPICHTDQVAEGHSKNLWRADNVEPAPQ